MKGTLTLVLLALFAVLVSGCGVAKVVTSGDYILESGEILSGDLVITSGQVTLEEGSHVIGQVLVTSGNLNVNGEIDGDIVGTPHYIAPEAWEGQAATPQTDIYALGCILYEMLTGEKVFKGETPPQVMMAHFSPLELPKIWPEGVPSGVADVLGTALAREPANRYVTAGEMAKRLATLTPKKLP